MKSTTTITARSERGQSLVELAISLTVMLLLLSGAVSFGMAFFSYVAMRDAAQEGALYGSFAPCDANADGKCEPAEYQTVNVAGVRTRVRASSKGPLDFSTFPDSDIDVTVLPSGQACEGNTIVNGVETPHAIQVTVHYRYQIFMPFVGAILGSQQIPMHATVTDTILAPRCPTP